jgi:hypothetical protein
MAYRKTKYNSEYKTLKRHIFAGRYAKLRRMKWKLMGKLTK